MGEKILRGLGVALCAVGCASPAARPATTPPPPPAAPREEARLEPPRVRIVDPRLAESRSIAHETVMVPFGVNQNGTELMYALLEHAARDGARYVSDVKMFMTFRWKGTAVECRTSVMLEGDPRLAAPGAHGAAAAAGGAYRTDVTAYQPQKVDFVADDRELACRKVNVAVNQWRRARDSDRDVENGRLKRVDPDTRELVTKIEERDACEWRSLTRPTSRYDYEVKLGFVPPNWEHLQQRFARRNLVAAPATCYALAEEEVAKQPMYRVTATAYRRAKVAQRMPDVLSSMSMVNPSNDPEQISAGMNPASEGCG